MIDPSIALSFRSPEIQDGLDIAAKQSNLASMANQQQLQQAQLTQANLQNQQTQMAIDRTKTLNASWAKAYDSAMPQTATQPGTPASGLPTDPSAGLPGAPAYAPGTQPGAGVPSAPNGASLGNAPAYTGPVPLASIGTPSASGASPSPATPPPATPPPGAPKPAAANGGVNPDFDFGKIAAQMPTLLAQAGQGGAIQDVMKGVTEYQSAIADLAKKRVDLNAAQMDAAGSIGSTVQKAGNDPHLFLALGLNAIHANAVDATAIQPVLKQVYDALGEDEKTGGHTANDLTQQFAAQWANQSDKEQTLSTAAQSAQGTADRGKAALGELALRMKQAGIPDPGKWVLAGTSNGYSVYANPTTKQTWTDPVKVDMTPDGGGGAGRQLTPDAIATIKARNNTDFQNNQQSELDAQQQVGALASALRGGTSYVNDKGRTVPFSSMTDANKNPLSATDIATYQDEMRQRLAVAQKGYEMAVAAKNNAIMNNVPYGGAPPQVSTDQAIAGSRKGLTDLLPQLKPAAPTPQNATRGVAPTGSPETDAVSDAPPPAIVAKMLTGKVTTFNNGSKWIKNANGSITQVK